MPGLVECGDTFPALAFRLLRSQLYSRNVAAAFPNPSDSTCPLPRAESLLPRFAPPRQSHTSPARVGGVCSGLRANVNFHLGLLVPQCWRSCGPLVVFTGKELQGLTSSHPM